MHARSLSATVALVEVDRHAKNEPTLAATSCASAGRIHTADAAPSSPSEANRARDVAAPRPMHRGARLVVSARAR